MVIRPSPVGHITKHLDPLPRLRRCDSPTTPMKKRTFVLSSAYGIVVASHRIGIFAGTVASLLPKKDRVRLWPRVIKAMRHLAVNCDDEEDSRC